MFRFKSTVEVFKESELKFINFKYFNQETADSS